MKVICVLDLFFIGLLGSSYFKRTLLKIDLKWISQAVFIHSKAFIDVLHYAKLQCLELGTQK